MDGEKKEQVPMERAEQGQKPVSTADMAAAQPKTNAATMTAEKRPMAGDGNRGMANTRPTPLLKSDEIQSLRNRWSTIQAAFVDEPRQSVEQADTLVAELMQKLAQMFAAEKNNLEQQWGRGQEASTEDLRVSLQHYRSFFDRLLSF